MMRNKRGFIFSIITVLILISLIVIVSSYIARTDKVNNIREEAFVSEKLRYIENDIAIDYLRINNISLQNITRLNSTNKVVLRFDSFGPLPKTGITSNLSSYETYIESQYSNLINTELSLTNLNSNITFTEYNTTFEIIDSSNTLNIWTDLYTSIEKIEVEVKIDADGFTGQSTCPSPDSAPNPDIRAALIGNDGAVDCTIDLSPTDTCSSNEFVASKGSNKFYVRFCQVNGKPGTLQLQNSGFSAHIRSIKYTYAAQPIESRLQTSQTTLKINPNLANILKDSNILLGGESFYQIFSFCEENSDCPSGQACSAGKCVPGDTCTNYCLSQNFSTGSCVKNTPECTSQSGSPQPGGNNGCNQGSGQIGGVCCCFV